MRMARKAAVVLLCAVAFVAAGCGGGGGKQSFTALELVSQAVSKTTTSNSAKVHLAITSGAFTVTADGVADSASHTARMTVDAPGWKADVVLDRATVYLKLPPALAKLVPGGKPWVELDLAQLSKLKGVDLAQLLQLAGQQDPTQALQLLQSVGDVREAGREQIGGVDTTKYSGTLDPQKIAATFSGSGLATILRHVGATPIPVTVWIDGDGFVRKLDESDHTAAADVEIEATLSDFGVNVDVTPPPADQTTDLAALLGRTRSCCSTASRTCSSAGSCRRRSTATPCARSRP